MSPASLKATKFIDIAGQTVRLDAVTRLSAESVAGSPGVTAHYVYTTDGGILYVTEEEWENVKQALTSEASGASPVPEKKVTTKTKDRA